MSIKKALRTLALATAFAVPGLAAAAPITVAGVTWDPDSILDFSSFSVAIVQDIDPVTGVASGYGVISTMNGNDASVFIPGGELTFQFGGFTPVQFGNVPDVLSEVIAYTGGWVNVYADATKDILNPANPTTLSLANTHEADNVLFLSLTGHPTGLLNRTLTGSRDGTNKLSGLGSLDVSGGAAAANFDTNTQDDGADFSFSNSFTLFLPNIFHVAGTGNFFSDSVAVPEPASLGLVGLAMLGLGFARRKKQG